MVLNMKANGWPALTSETDAEYKFGVMAHVTTGIGFVIVPQEEAV